MKILIGVLIGLTLAAVGGLFYLGHQSADAAPSLGLTGNKLAGCPASPNCISSSAQGDHAYPPWQLAPAASWPEVVAQVAAMEGAAVVDNSNGYLRAEYRSPVFGFIDDLELHSDGPGLAVRSASRVGHSDLGANRDRADELGRRLAAAGLLAGG